MNNTTSLLIGLIAITLTACSKDDSKNKNIENPDLAKIAAQITHDEKSCPANLTGHYCRDLNPPKLNENGHQTTRICDTVILNKTNKGLVYDNAMQAEDSKMEVDGKIHIKKFEDYTMQWLGYCQDKTLHLHVNFPGYGHMYLSYMLENNGKILIANEDSNDRGTITQETVRYKKIRDNVEVDLTLDEMRQPLEE